MRNRGVAVAAAKSMAMGVICALALQILLDAPAIAGPEETELAASAAYARADYSTALALIRPLAELGNVRAQVDLGGLYYEGFGVAKDAAEACRWIRKAADQDFAPGEFFMAKCSTEGAGAPKDRSEAVRWLRKAADQGYAPAEFELGNPLSALLFGAAAPRDRTETARWFQKAVADEYPPALLWAGLPHAMHFWPQEQEQAIRWFRMAADRGDVTAEEQLGRMYSQGMGIQPDYAEALKWDLKAAEQGDTGAQSQLSRLYAEGKGVPQDSVQARMWFDLSQREDPKAVAVLGKAAVKLDKLSEQIFEMESGPMTETQKAQAKGMAAAWLSAHPGASRRSTDDPSMWVSGGVPAPVVRLKATVLTVKHRDRAPLASPSQPNVAAFPPAEGPHPCTHDEANQKRIAIQNGYTTIPNCQ